MGVFGRSWAIARESLRALRADRALLLFPVISALVSFVSIVILVGLGLLLSAMAPGVRSLVESLTADPQQGGTGARYVAGLAVLFLYYLDTSIVVTFFQAGLIGAALIRLRGGAPSFGDGLALAGARFWAIAGYAAFAATVGVLLAVLRGRGGRRNVAREVAAGLGEAAWQVATFLVVPVLVATPADPATAIKESARLLKRTWGEQLVGSGGIGLVLLAPVLVIIAIGAVGVAACAASDLWVGAAAVLIVAVLLLALVAAVGAALSGIYKAAVYLYAAEGQVPAAFAAPLVQGAFRPAAA